MGKDDIALMAHLMRRAGFGATRQELDGYVAKGYEATVEAEIETAERILGYRPQDDADVALDPQDEPLEPYYTHTHGT